MPLRAAWSLAVVEKWPSLVRGVLRMRALLHVYGLQTRLGSPIS